MRVSLREKERERDSALLLDNSREELGIARDTERAITIVIVEDREELVDRLSENCPAFPGVSVATLVKARLFSSLSEAGNRYAELRRASSVIADTLPDSSSSAITVARCRSSCLPSSAMTECNSVSRSSCRAACCSAR